MVMEVVHEDTGEGSMQCTNHPYRNSAPGGICAFCLQEKLGKLVSSSFHTPIFPSSSSSSSPSFRSDVSTLQVRNLALNPQIGGNGCDYTGYHSRRGKLPFVLTHRRRKKKDGGAVIGANPSDPSNIVFKRSKSTAASRRGMQFLDEKYAEDYSPNRRGFWSFLYLSKQKLPHKNLKDLSSKSGNRTNVSTTVGSSGSSSSSKKREESVADEGGESPDVASFDRKVSRSRSVGCGSRSFSGDFFERISTGFGDCTLRRVESHREGKPKVQSLRRNSGGNGHDCIKERVKCGGIFSGFMVTSSSSSSSSSSYWVASSSIGHLRSKSWGWAFASPMRAFGKPKRDASQDKNATPNLSAIPSLLAVSG